MRYIKCLMLDKIQSRILNGKIFMTISRETPKQFQPQTRHTAAIIVKKMSQPDEERAKMKSCHKHTFNELI